MTDPDPATTADRLPGVRPHTIEHMSLLEYGLYCAVTDRQETPMSDPDPAATAREAVARCLADVEDFPEPEHYALADDVLLALLNAGYIDLLTNRARAAERQRIRQARRASQTDPVDGSWLYLIPAGLLDGDTREDT